MTGEHLEMKDLELLAKSPETGPSSDNRELELLQEHLKSCAQCAGTAEVFRKVLLAASSPDPQIVLGCSSEEEWYACAAGIASPESSAALLEHAQKCRSCAATLKAALQDLEGPIETEELKLLSSSAPEWQSSLAARMATTSRTTDIKSATEVRWWRNWFSMRFVLSAAAAVLIAAVAAVGIWIYQQQTDQALLARAYNQRRLTELYLPGGDPRPVDSPTLGESDGEDVVPLLKLKERAQQHLDKNPNDAYWQQTMGRIALAEGNGQRALSKFELALSLDPSLVGITFDLAAAHFEIAVSAQKPSEFATAADLFGLVIDTRNSGTLRSAAYYNRALCWEQLAIYSRAVADYQEAARVEKSARWRRWIESRLDSIKIKAQNGNGRTALELNTSPQGFLELLRSNPQRANQYYEIYFEHAVREWLLGRDASAGRALDHLATLGLQHQDAWLRDLRNHHDGRSRAAIAHLEEGLQANIEGNADRALSSLSAAAQSFRQNNNSAGLVRARAEILYTLQRMGRSDDCLKFLAAHPSGEQLRRYAWLDAYQTLEASICRAARGDSASYLHDIRESIERSKAAGLPIQVLRERGILIESLDDVGETEAALRSAVAGLEECADGAPCLPMRVYQFEHSLTAILEERQLRSAACDAARAAADTSTLVENLQIRAYAQEVLAKDETAAGHLENANMAFSQATALLKGMPDGDAAGLYRADWEADRAALLEREGRLTPALEQLRAASPKIAKTDNFDVRQRHYTRLAALLLDAERPREALNTSLTAVADAEYALSRSRTESEKLSWEKTYGLSYRLLAKSQVAMGREREALETWEWYRSAPYRIAGHLKQETDPPIISTRLSFSGAGQGNKLILVIARLEDDLVVWSIERPAEPIVHMVREPMTAQRVLEMARTFSELCSNENSSEQDIVALGGRLYQALLAPVDDQIQRAPEIVFDVDPSLERVPFSALMRPDHRYISDGHALSFLAARWSLGPSPPTTILPDATALLVEGATSLPESGGGRASSIPVADLQTEAVASYFRHTVILRGNDASVGEILKHISEADVFHYNGHTSTSSEGRGLLLQANHGLFTAANLRGVSLRHCRLAVLATCSSARGNGESMEDVSNLAHELLVSGAGNVVATLWDVDARASRTMMLSMYSMLTRSMSVPVAISAAQQKLRSDPATHHPYFWSGVQVFAQ